MSFTHLSISYSYVGLLKTHTHTHTHVKSKDFFLYTLSRTPKSRHVPKFIHAWAVYLQGKRLTANYKQPFYLSLKKQLAHLILYFLLNLFTLPKMMILRLLLRSSLQKNEASLNKHIFHGLESKFAWLWLPSVAQSPQNVCTTLADPPRLGSACYRLNLLYYSIIFFGYCIVCHNQRFPIGDLIMAKMKRNIYYYKYFIYIKIK